MAAEDIHAQATTWAFDETSKQCFGEDIGVAVSFTLMPVGQMLVPVWQLLLTLRNPLLGEGPLYHGQPVGNPQQIERNVHPQEDTIRAAVGEGIRALRDLRARKLAGMNGKTPAQAVSG